MSRRARTRDERLGVRLGRWAAAAAIALALHLLFMFALSVSHSSFLSTSGGGAHLPPSPVTLRSMAPSQWAQNREIRPPGAQREAAKAAPPEQEPPKPTVEREKMPEGRIVETAPGNHKRPDNSRFLSESDNTVEKETVSRHMTPNYRNPAPVPTSPAPEAEAQQGHDAANRKTVAGNQGLGQDERPMKQGGHKGAFEIPSTEKREGLALHMDGTDGEVANRKASDQVNGNSDRLRVLPGDDSGEDSEGSTGKRGEQNVLTLTPSSSVIGRIVGAPVNDLNKDLDDLEEGEGTYLNTREWKYASFFNRVRENVGMNWNPNIVVATRDPTGQMYFFKDRYTVLAVTLDRDGTLKGAAVRQSSGVLFLDDEAIAAFQRVKSFPHPPAALLDENGEIRFNFGFYFEVGHSALRFFR